MERHEIDTLHNLMEYEAARTAPKGVTDPRTIRLPDSAEIETVSEIGRTCTALDKPPDQSYTREVKGADSWNGNEVPPASAAMAIV